MAVLPITITGSPLPEGENFTPQEFMDAIVARLALETQESYVLIGTGSVLPTSDQGPFMLNGTTLYVWDSGSGAYVPQTIEFEADIDPKPWRANSAGAQTIVFASAGADSVDLVLTEEYDPGSVFAASAFVAPVDGIYNVKAKMGISATVGTPTDNIVLFYLKKNGFQMARETVFEELVDVATGRTYLIDTNLELQAGDTITATVQVSIGGGTATWTITQNETWMSGHKIMSS
jgi:hypothetical protein